MRVAGTHAIAPYTFQMVEKRQNIVAAKPESELINRPVVSFGEEPQQNPEGVAVGIDSERADVALRAEMVGEEAFDKDGKWIGGHELGIVGSLITLEALKALRRTLQRGTVGRHIPPGGVEALVSHVARQQQQVVRHRHGAAAPGGDQAMAKVCRKSPKRTTGRAPLGSMPRTTAAKNSLILWGVKGTPRRPTKKCSPRE